MSRPPLPPTRWDIDRDLDRPEDEVFGLIDADLGLDAPAGDDRFGSAQQAAAKIVGAVEGITSRFQRPGKDRKREAELAELASFQQQATGGSAVLPSSRVAAMDPDLDQHIIRLPSNRDFSEFLAAEQETSLFERYEQTRAQNLRFGGLGLWIASILFVLLGLKTGQGYVHGLLDENVLPPQMLTEQAGEQAAGAVMFCAGLLAPVLTFVLLAYSAGDLLQGLFGGAPRKLPGALVGCTAAAVTLLLCAAGAPLAAIAVTVGAQALIGVLRRMGGR